MKDKNGYSQRGEKLSTIKKYKAECAVRKLIEDIDSIRNVKQWAEKSGMSESTINRLTKEIYRKTPGTIFKEVKYEKVLYELSQDDEACAYSIAKDSGFENEDTLRMFLRRGFDTNISTLREQFFFGEFDHDWSWIIGK